MPEMAVDHYFNYNKYLQKNHYYPFNRTEFYLAQMWLHRGIGQAVMDRIIKDFRDIKPAGTPRKASDLLRQDDIRIRSIQDIKKIIELMPESHDGTTWIKKRVNLPAQWKALNILPEGQGLYVYIRKDIWKVIKDLFGNPRFSGLIYTKFCEKFDRTTTYRNENGDYDNPRIYGEMWTAEWWRETEVT
jgi:hypothetical protein